MVEEIRGHKEHLTQETKPTELVMFQYPADVLSRSRRLHEDLTGLARMKDLTDRKTRNQKERLGTTVETVKERKKATNDQIESVVSSITTSKAYLIFLHDFSERGLSEEDIFAFFKICLDTNTKIYAQFKPPEGEDEGQFNARTAIRRDAAPYKEMAKIQARASHIQPNWFLGSKEEYFKMFERYSNLGRLFDQDIPITPLGKIEIFKKYKIEIEENGIVSDKAYGPTHRDGLPDWLLNSEGKAPLKEDVEAELQNDLEEEDDLREKVMAYHKQQKYLLSSFQERTDKSSTWFQETLDGAIKGIEYNLATALIYSRAFPDLGDKQYQVLLHDIATHPNPELYSLWIEGKLKAAGIISGEGLSSESLESLRRWIAFQRKENPEAEAAFKAMRYTNKEGYNILWHELGPIIDALSEDRIILLKDFIDDCEASDANILVTFLADLFFEELKKTDTLVTLVKSLESCKTFIRKFTNNNNSWLYDQLIKRLYCERPESNSLGDGYLEVGLSAESEPEVLIREFDQELDEINKDKLVGWKVCYSMDRVIKESSLVEIPGETVEDKSRFLQQFIGSRSISCSVKPDVVIKALESKAESAGTLDDYIIHKKRVGSDVWKKIEKGPIRVLYQMFPDDKLIYFFIHQKKDFYFGF